MNDKIYKVCIVQNVKTIDNSYHIEILLKLSQQKIEYPWIHWKRDPKSLVCEQNPNAFQPLLASSGGEYDGYSLHKNIVEKL